MLLRVVAVVGSSLKYLEDTLLKHQHEEDEAAKGTLCNDTDKRLRLYANRCYQKRIRRAFRIIAAVMVTKILLWRYQKQCHAANIVKAFLRDIVKRKIELGLIMAVILQVQRLKLQKNCAATVQEFRRTRLNAIRRRRNDRHAVEASAGGT